MISVLYAALHICFCFLRLRCIWWILMTGQIDRSSFGQRLSLTHFQWTSAKKTNRLMKPIKYHIRLIFNGENIFCFIFLFLFFIDSCLKATSIWMQSSGRWHLILRRFSNRERNESEIKFKLLRTLFNQVCLLRRSIAPNTISISFAEIWPISEKKRK